MRLRTPDFNECVQTLRHVFTAHWQKGILNYVADALSRYPTSDPVQDDQLAEQASRSPYQIAALHQRDDLSTKLRDVHDVALNDNVYQKLKHTILRGFPHSTAELPDVLKQF